MNLEEEVDKDPILPSFNATMFDAAAFEVFFKKNFAPLCAYCQHKFDFNLELAKDTVHTGFIKLWENRQYISPELSIRSYIYKSITNICLDILKHEKVKHNHIKFTTYEASEKTVTPDDNSIDYKKLEADIENAINELPEQMRRIFKLSRYEELKYAEIANQLNISIKTVETQMSRALLKLRLKLSRYLLNYILLFFGLWKLTGH